jgi:hypothetical protein
VGRVTGSCRVVAVAGDGTARALCSRHFEWDGGASVMVTQSTEFLRPDGAQEGKLMILGGIGKWQGAHGEDLEFKYDAKTGAGGGKIVLYCLDGVC